MAWRKDDPQLTTAEAFDVLTVDELKPLAALLTNDVPKRKPELVRLLAGQVTHAHRVRDLYEKLPALAKAAVQDAVHDDSGVLHRDRFIARHGRLPDFHEPIGEGEKRIHTYRYSKTKPTALLLFFPTNFTLPTDLCTLLEGFVPPPEEFALQVQQGPPESIARTWQDWQNGEMVEQSEQLTPRIRETAAEALHDVKAVLRLVEAGRVRVSDKKKQPTADTLTEIDEVLLGGDFYSPQDQDDSAYDPEADVAIKAFAWPMIVQAAGLAQAAGAKLELTAAGRKALTQAGPDIIRAAFKKWSSSTLLDEFSRVEAIKGQAKGKLTALVPRRKAVLEGLAACPPLQWFNIDDFFRFLRATDRDFEVAHNPYALYVGEHRYGYLGQAGDGLWDLLQARYIMAVLLEYAATLGLVDVAYLQPQGARGDFRDHWGTDELSCLSLYDGLMSLRINALGAWCLGLAESYEPPPREIADMVQVLPNLDIVARHPPLPPSDRLLLDRFAEKQSDAVWRLSGEHIRAVLESGGSLDELSEFLSTRSSSPLPQTVAVFLQDQRDRADKLRDLGSARLLECVDRQTAQMLASDPLMKGVCFLAGERWLVFQAKDEKKTRQALRRLGYVLPGG